MPDDFVGLSYEVQQLTDPTFFSANNTGLIQEFKALAPRGVLRLGGNASEFAYWKPTPGSPEPGHPPIREVEGEPKAQYYAVTSEAVRNLAGFLKATGWTCLYGIGMGTNTPARAAEEAGFAAKTLGSSLQYFQIGNEVDLFSRMRDQNVVARLPGEWLACASRGCPRAASEIRDAGCAAYVEWLTDIADVWFRSRIRRGDNAYAPLLLRRTGTTRRSTFPTC